MSGTTEPILHEILWVKESELRALEDSVARPNGGPQFMCVTSAGTVRMWPRFTPSEHRLFYKVEKLR